MLTQKKGCTLIPMATTTQDLHIVVAAIESQGQFVGYTAITAPLTYDEALKVWESKQRYKVGVNIRGGNKGHVCEYAVRSVADPRFSPLVGQGYDNGTSKSGYTIRNAPVKAAKAWAKEFGYTGKAGGWIYDASGDPVTQGWANFASNLRRLGRIAQGSDGKWYVIDREMVK